MAFCEGKILLLPCWRAPDPQRATCKTGGLKNRGWQGRIGQEAQSWVEQSPLSGRERAESNRGAALKECRKERWAAWGSAAWTGHLQHWKHTLLIWEGSRGWLWPTKSFTDVANEQVPMDLRDFACQGFMMIPIWALEFESRCQHLLDVSP